MTIPPQDMVLFAVVVREGGFTRAASVLGITKQSASERIGRLETRLGVRLLERTTRRVRTTEAGQVYYERCQAIAEQIDEANRELVGQQRAPTGLLRVSAPYLFSRRFLAPIVVDYMTRHPSVRVELVLDDRRVNLVDESFDLAIRVGALDDSSLSSRAIGLVRVALMASPSFVARTPLASPRDLRGEHCIGLRKQEMWRLGEQTLKVNPRLVVNDLEIAYQAATLGLGVAWLPSLVVGDAVSRGALRELWSELAIEVPMHALFPSKTSLSIKVRAFVDLLVASLSAGGRRPAPARRRH